MAKLDLTIRRSGQKLLVELNADRLEKLASTLGFFNPEFLTSLKRSLKDEKQGRVKPIETLLR